MDQQKFEHRCAITFCVKLGESAAVTYEKLHRAYEEQSGHKCSDGTSPFQKAENKWKNLVLEDLQPQKQPNVERVGSLVRSDR